MDEVLYSFSRPCRPGITGVANQVYNVDYPMEFVIKTIRVGIVTAI